MKKALIFGVTGQDGWYLTELLRSQNVATLGVARSGGDVLGDVADRDTVKRVITSFQPDYVFHLAANSTTSHDVLWDSHETIGTGTLNILDAVENHAPGARVLLAGSALQFQNAGSPLDETAPLDHSSPYVLARNYSLQAARYYRDRGLKVYFAYLFNHDSPRRTARHLNMKIALAAANRQPIHIGDLDAEKEFTFAGDTVAGMWTILQQEDHHEVIIGSGISRPVRDWLEACYGLEDLNWSDYVAPNSSYTSPYKRLVSNPSRLRGLGWTPTCDFNKLAELMMHSARQASAK